MIHDSEWLDDPMIGFKEVIFDDSKEILTIKVYKKKKDESKSPAMVKTFSYSRAKILFPSNFSSREINKANGYPWNCRTIFPDYAPECIMSLERERWEN